MKYGKSGLPLSLPEDSEIEVLQKRKLPVFPDPESAVRKALASPLGCSSLTQEAKGCRNVCLLICDITRPVPHSVLLPILIRELLHSGFSADAITLLVATGTHRPNEGEELRELIGDEWVFNSIPIVNHFAAREDEHVDLGTTPKGTPVKIARRFMDADLRMVVGLVEPHFMAGYSGGRKVVVPGIAHADTIQVIHSTRMLNQDEVRPGRMEGNPLHEELLQAIEKVGKILAINTVIDQERNLSFINFGEIRESHSAAVSFARPYFEIPVSRKFRTIVTSASGYPLDKTYYQTIKGMMGVVDILEEGGDIFIVSECSEGLGSTTYREAQTRLIQCGAEAFLAESASSTRSAMDAWETVMQIRAMKRGKVHLYSEGLNWEEKKLTGVEVIDNLTQA
ncbi:MAG: nickel-dependent lactate racemase, partial [Thermodesulfobacteriota bacterium]